MKKYLQKERPAKFYYICDIYPKERPVLKKDKQNVAASLILTFNYGSGRDGHRLNLDLSPKASEEIYQMLIDKYGEKIIKNLTKSYMF